jgi:hypothetical protein
MWQDINVSEILAASIFTSAYILYSSLNLHSEGGGRKVLRNVGILPHHYTVSKLRTRLEFSSPCRLNITLLNTDQIEIFGTPF